MQINARLASSVSSGPSVPIVVAIGEAGDSVDVSTVGEGEGEKVVRKAVEMALAGNETALRLVVERLIPPVKERPIQLDLPGLGKGSDVAEASIAVLNSEGAVPVISYFTVSPANHRIRPIVK
jgi:hypothetical protein